MCIKIRCIGWYFIQKEEILLRIQPTSAKITRWGVYGKDRIRTWRAVFEVCFESGGPWSILEKFLGNEKKFNISCSVCK